MRIDVNADCGESLGSWTLGDDAALLKHVTSANIACGGHAGDPVTMKRTVRLAKEEGVSIGAHPSFPDLVGFGRRMMYLTPEEIAASVVAQTGALAAIARTEGAAVGHVKLHGAVYHHAATDLPVAQALAKALAALDRRLIVIAPAASALEAAGLAAGLRIAREAYCDRAYADNGALVPREQEGAMILDEEACVDQALRIAAEGYAVSITGRRLPMRVESLCVHGDAPDAPRRAAIIRRGLEAAGVKVEPLPNILTWR